MKQFLCSHLVILQFPGQEAGGNLERIWHAGATVNSEEPVPPGTRVTICSPRCNLRGIVMSCDSDPLGNFLDIAFDTEWTLEAFRPDHLMDPEFTLGGRDGNIV